MSLHDRIKEARINKGLTQEQLGELIGVAKTTVAGYEKKHEPTAAKVGEIADALNVDVNFLFQDEVREYHKNHATPEEFSNIIEKYRFITEHSSEGAKIVDMILDREYSVALRQKEQAEKANILFNNPDYKPLFNADTEIKPEYIGFINELLDKLNNNQL